MIHDPIVEEVRSVRKAIEAECGNDPTKYLEHLRKLERKYASRLVSRGPKPVLTAAHVAEERDSYG